MISILLLQSFFFISLLVPGEAVFSGCLNGAQFAVLTQTATFSAAGQQCSDLVKNTTNDGFIARISSQTEYDFVLAFLQANAFTGAAWVGLLDTDADTSLAATNPARFDYIDNSGASKNFYLTRAVLPWSANAPSSVNTNNCVRWQFGANSVDGRWFDEPCANSRRVLCRFSCQTSSPTKSPTTSPTLKPTKFPTKQPTHSPTISPTKAPTESPTKNPTKFPTISPTKNPTNSPTKSPTRNPTASPTKSPTKFPTTSPTKNPTDSPTRSPTKSPTHSPTISPTASPTTSPSKNPTTSPSFSPTLNPTTLTPTKSPSQSPTKNPSVSPTLSPTKNPTQQEGAIQQFFSSSYFMYVVIAAGVAILVLIAGVVVLIRRRSKKAPAVPRKLLSSLLFSRNPKLHPKEEFAFENPTPEEMHMSQHL